MLMTHEHGYSSCVEKCRDMWVDHANITENIFTAGNVTVSGLSSTVRMALSVDNYPLLNVPRLVNRSVDDFFFVRRGIAVIILLLPWHACATILT